MDVNYNFNFPWPILKVVLEGTSILDVPRLEIKSMEEATNFVVAYGFDPTSGADIDLLWSFFGEAVEFIEKALADPQNATIPDHLRTRDRVNDIRRLVIIASDTTLGTDQKFCCAILRVMHVLIHLAFDPRMRFFEQVQNQVLTRLDQYLFVDSQTGVIYLGRKEDGRAIKLLFFKKKDRKDKTREIIKLLHKSSNLVEEIYDRVGFRLVTETKFDAMRAVRLLLEENIISLPNVRPGRSRNRLFNLKRLQFEVDRIATHLAKTAEPAPYVERMIKRLEKRIGFRSLGRSFINPHSSEYFRAIQFTCRAMIRVNNPTHQILLRLSELLSTIHGATEVLHEAFPRWPQPFEYVFFPFEIQLMDVKSYADSIFGKSNYEEYRHKQLGAARDRVFGRPDALK